MSLGPRCTHFMLHGKSCIDFSSDQWFEKVGEIMGTKCCLCFKKLQNPDVINLVSGDLVKQLNDIVLFSLDTPLTSDSKLCKTCVKVINERTEIWTKLSEMDAGIRDVYYGSIFKTIWPKSDVERRLQTEKKVPAFLGKYPLSDKAWQSGDARVSLKCVKEEGISGIKRENGTVKSELCEDKQSNCLYKLEKELWDDDIKCETTIDKNNK